MVEYIEKQIWNCPYCSKEYEDYEKALECSQECADIDYPKEDTKTIFVCEYCKKTFSDDQEVDECEENHRENRDEFYSKIELKKASEHPEQKRLIATMGGSQ